MKDPQHEEKLQRDAMIARFQINYARLRVARELAFFNLELLKSENIVRPVKDLEEVRKRILSGEFKRSDLSKKLLDLVDEN